MKAFSATIAGPNEDKSLPNAQSTSAQVSVTPIEHESTRLLKENSERYQAIVDTAVDAIIVADRFGEVRSFNRAAETIFGYSADEVIDRNIKFLMPEAYQVKHDGYLAAYRDTGERKIIGIGREVVGLRKDGTTVALELSIAEWRDANGTREYPAPEREL